MEAINLIDSKHLVKTVNVDGLNFDIYKIQNESYNIKGGYKYLFFAGGVHPKEGITTKKLNIQSLRKPYQIECMIKTAFNLWKQ